MFWLLSKNMTNTNKVDKNYFSKKFLNNINEVRLTDEQNYIYMLYYYIKFFKKKLKFFKLFLFIWNIK